MPTLLNTTLDFTTPQTVLAVTAAVVGQSHIALNLRMVVMICCKKNRNRHFFLDLDKEKRNQMQKLFA